MHLCICKSRFVEIFQTSLFFWVPKVFRIVIFFSWSCFFIGNSSLLVLWHFLISWVFVKIFCGYCSVWKVCFFSSSSSSSSFFFFFFWAKNGRKILLIRKQVHKRNGYKEHQGLELRDHPQQLWCPKPIEAHTTKARHKTKHDPTRNNQTALWLTSLIGWQQTVMVPMVESGRMEKKNTNPFTYPSNHEALTWRNENLNTKKEEANT